MNLLQIRKWQNDKPLKSFDKEALNICA